MEAIEGVSNLGMIERITRRALPSLVSSEIILKVFGIQLF
jgi:hypothetical protein